VRNDIPPLRLKLSGSLERQTAIADELDREGIGYRDDVDLGTFIEAGELIRHVWPEEYRDFQETLQVVVPREVPYGWRARGMTVSSYQGAIWIMARGLLPIFENLIHEHSHVKLRYIEEYLPILAPEQPETRFVVGWRTDVAGTPFVA
jgi:HEXXH motif-containing protein